MPSKHPPSTLLQQIKGHCHRMFLPGPLELIQARRIGDFRCLLEAGLSPDKVCEMGITLLGHAITTNELGFTALLLLHGANPNKTTIVENKQTLISSNIFILQYHNVSLALLLLSYGADYSSLDTPSNHNENFHRIWSLRENRFTMHQALLDGNRLLKENDYLGAQNAYTKAKEYLEEFLAEEQQKFSAQTGRETEFSQQTHPIILECYQHRLDHCQSQLAAIKRTLPPKPSDERGIRRRHISSQHP